VLPAAAPSPVLRLLHRCLEKDRRRRLADCADVRLELEDLLAGPEGSGATTSRAPRSLAPLWGAAALTALAVVMVVVVWRPWPGSGGAVSVTPALRFALPLPPTFTLGLANPALTDDGTRLAYVTFPRGLLGVEPSRLNLQIHVRSMTSAESVPVAGTEGGEHPFFSPDGESMGFFANGRLKAVSVGGGTPLDVCDAPNALGGAWGRDGTIVFSSRGRLLKVSATGGAPVPLTEPDPRAQELTHSRPQILPDGRTVLFTISHIGGRPAVAVVPVQGGPVEIVLESAGAGRFASGRLVFTRAGRIMAVPFQPGTRPGDTAVAVIDDAAGIPFAVSSVGSLVYVSVPARIAPQEVSLVWLDRRGVKTPLNLPIRRYVQGALSPDGSRVALRINDGGSNIWVGNISRGTLTRLTADGGDNPAWTRDGRFVTYNRGSNEIVRREADGSRAEEILWRASPSEAALGMAWLSWSPDGVLAVQRILPTRNHDIWLLRDARLEVFDPHGRFAKYNQHVSPDGRWISYTADDSGQPEVYIQPFPRSGAAVQVSVGGGQSGRWAPDGRELFYLRSRTMMAVPIRFDPTPMAGESKPLFDVEFTGGNQWLDVTPDGQRFLSVTPRPAGVEHPGDLSLDAAETRRLMVVVNWPSLVTAR